MKTFLPQGANIAFGITTDKEWNGKVQVNMIALGLENGIHEISNNWNISMPVSDPVQEKEKPSVQAVPRISRVPKPIVKPKQTTIDFKPSFKGRFDKSNPTYLHGEDLDIPTFLRKKKAGAVS